MRPPSIAEYRRWQRAAGGLIGIVTLSPHHPGSREYVAALHADGVHAAVGHTHATGAEIDAAAGAGAVLSTHLGNGAHGELPRHPNYIWSQLADDRLTATFIADGHHLPGEVLRSMLRAKGPGRSVLVSDAVALAGMPPGSYETPVGGTVELSADGRLSRPGTPFLAGAACSLADAVARVTGLAGIGLADAVTLATASPARFLPPGCPDRGVLRAGAAADVITFRWRPGDPTLDVRTVLAGGRPVTTEARHAG
ncbi:hypothetical protein [Pseudonocardia sp. HH130630-07]|uniref:hypothetical protein n=1 Tax=Pseudonocardia sp. HH130630-07 TaxID=1690815 RepID=UPI0012EAECCC|nr:hypothetical protein [Pseudonocardia sp. HH130630-07]